MKDVIRSFIGKAKAPAPASRPGAIVVLPKPNRNQTIIKGL